MATKPRNETIKNPATQKLLMWNISSPLADSLFSWSNVVLIIGAALVLIGTISSIKMAAIREHFADVRISDNEVATKKAVAESDVAKSDAAKANERAAALEKEAAELKTANLALEAKIQPRRLSGEESRKLSDVLSSAPPGAVAVVSRLLDSEGEDFGDDLATAINNGRWQSARYRNWTRSDKGVFIATVEGTPLPLSVAILRAALAAAGVPYSISTISSDDHTMSPWFQPNVLYLLVGAKP